MIQRLLLPALAIISTICQTNAQSQAKDPTVVDLPGRYFKLLEAGITRVQERLAVEPEATLASLEAMPGWSHFPNTILMPAVLYKKSHPLNKRHGDTSLLKLAIRIGDLLATEYEKGNYTARHDNDWDTYMWLEAYRLLENKLGVERRLRWKQVILKELALLEPKLALCQDYPMYNAPFITTSPNHYSIYASTLLVGGHVFDKPEWVKLSNKVLHRFCVKEQTVDGYWGEHSQAGPTTGYDYLTVTQIALYWEYSKDPEALKALRRSTDFHKYFTYPDGTPVETINDRNRHWEVSMWGQFGFSHFPDGRRYAEFLAGFSTFDGDKKSDGSDIQSLGRIAQNAIYYHEGKTGPIPQDQTNYSHAMKVPAGIRKTGPWVVSLSGIIAPPVTLNGFFIDRQANMSVFHKKTGLIISGANSKRQPELATFTEVIGKDSIHMPVSSDLQMGGNPDRLALAYNTFFAVLEVPKPSGMQLKFSFITTYKWGDAVSGLALQLVLKAGQVLETGTGKKITLGEEKIEWGDQELGGLLRHNGWQLHLPTGMKFTWPVYPFNPYSDGPETSLEQAIGTLSVPLRAENQEFRFRLEVD
ncbi:MAG: hypothetical protein ABI760_23245 [Ferruginibacter sp.]